jgi:O-antigen/teichoic acid export membrane protein
MENKPKGMKIINLKTLLLHNNTIKQTIFKNTFWLGVAEAASRVLKMVLMIYVARILGATEYGKFTFSLAFIALFSVFYESGLPLIVTREFSGEKEREKEFYSVLSLKIVLSLGALILIMIGSFFVTPDQVVRKVILILAIFSLISSFLVIIYAFFQARQRMEYQAWATILQAAVVTPVGIFVLLTFPSVINLSYSYLVSGIVALIFVLFFSHFKVLPLRVLWQKTIWLKFLKMSWPVAFITLFGLIYTYISSVMMGYMGYLTETGWYNAAYNIIQVVLLPASLISTSFYPVLSKFFKESKEKFQGTLQGQMKVMILLSFPLVAGGVALAAKIITFIYGAKFSPSILVFQIVILIVGFVFLSSPIHYLLIAVDQQKKVFYINAVGAVINVVLNLLLIPRFTLYGSAVATVITYFIMFILVVYVAKHFTAVSFFNFQLVKFSILALLATTVMYFLIKVPFIYNLSLISVLLVGVSVYFVTFYIFRKIASNFSL